MMTRHPGVESKRLFSLFIVRPAADAKGSALFWSLSTFELRLN